MGSINFFSEEISFKLKNKKKTAAWIIDCGKNEGKAITSLNFIFCSDNYLLEINTEYLNHKTFTDIITFDQSGLDDNGLEGDIYISFDRVKENAEKINVSFSEELYRVIIHGVLHLIGYTDKTIEGKAMMRKKEDSYLSLWKERFT